MTNAFANIKDFRNIDRNDPHSFLNIFSKEQRKYIVKDMPLGEGYLIFNNEFDDVKTFEDGDMLFVGCIKYNTQKGTKLFRCYLLWFKKPMPNPIDGFYTHYEFHFDVDVSRLKPKLKPFNKYLIGKCRKENRLWSGGLFPTKKKEDKHNEFIPEYTGYVKGICRENYLVPLTTKLWIRRSEINGKPYFKVWVDSTNTSPYQYKYYANDQKILLSETEHKFIDKRMAEINKAKQRYDYKIYVNEFRANNKTVRPKFEVPKKVIENKLLAPLEYEGRRIRKQAFKEQEAYNSIW